MTTLSTNPFTDTLVIPTEEYPRFLEIFWSCLPDANASHWKTEMTCDVTPAIERVKDLEIRLSEARKTAQEACTELGSKMWRTAVREWSLEQAQEALKKCI